MDLVILCVVSTVNSGKGPTLHGPSFQIAWLMVSHCSKNPDFARHIGIL